MTTATESHDAQLAAIKARHEAVRQKFADPGVTEIDGEISDLAMVHDAGLMSAYLDPLGRLWTLTLEGEPRRIVARMAFDPNAGRDPLLDPTWPVDDTQAAQGFKAHGD